MIPNYSQVNIVFMLAGKFSGIQSQYIKYRMACLGEIKDVLSFKLYFMQNIK